jgi:hypothetical protein
MFIKSLIHTDFVYSPRRLSGAFHNRVPVLVCSFISEAVIILAWSKSQSFAMSFDVNKMLQTDHNDIEMRITVLLALN